MIKCVTNEKIILYATHSFNFQQNTKHIDVLLMIHD